MDSIDLAWLTAGADPMPVVEALRRVERDTEEQLARIRRMLAWLEQAPGRADLYAQWARTGPSCGAVPAPRGTGETPAGPAGGGSVPWRVRILQAVAADRSRQWRLRELAEAIGQPNHRSLRVTAEELVARGELGRRMLAPRDVRYLAAAPAPGAAANETEDALD